MTDKLLEALNRVAELEELLGARPDFSMRLVLGDKQWPKVGDKLIGILMARDVVSRDAAYMVIYGNRPEVDQPDIKIIDVWMARMRPVLRAHDIKVETIWGDGFRMDRDNKAKLQALIDEYKAQHP